MDICVQGGRYTMRTVQATETAVSIWITEEAAPTKAQMLDLVRQALAERGLAPWAETEAECFAAGADTLVIARPGHRRAAFYFGDLEALLAGALRCADGESSLYKMGDGYVLTTGAETVCPALLEFGDTYTAAPDWECHAREQGMCLLRDRAVADLRRYFSR